MRTDTFIGLSFPTHRCCLHKPAGIPRRAMKGVLPALAVDARLFPARVPWLAMGLTWGSGAASVF